VRTILHWSVVLLAVLVAPPVAAQVENVPVTNQVYEYLDRLAVRGLLPPYSNASIPLSRATVASLLQAAETKRSAMTRAEESFLEKFQREFAVELGRGIDNAYVLIGSEGADESFARGTLSDREKFLFALVDSGATLFVELLGSLEYRGANGDSWGATGATLASIGGRVRGTALGTLGYLLQSTNGRLWGDKTFALSDPTLAGNYKLNEPESRFFDLTEAYIQLQLDWLNLQLGRERRVLGLGYSDRLLVSGTAPAFDFIKLGARYKAFSFTYFHGSLVRETFLLPGLPDEAAENTNKYLALHRFQFSPLDALTVSLGEMVIYQRLAPELAYLIPVNFFKSAEHQLGDKDNAFLFLDVEVYPIRNLKLYGSWLIDDIDFAKWGTGWWGNQFGWQAGAYASNVLGIEDVDALVEYARLEPYLYSNRLAGNSYTHNEITIGHSLPPNADEWLLELRYRPSSVLRLALGYRARRHGANVLEGDSLLRNVGGDALEGHRPGDAETVTFLDGVLETEHRWQVRAAWEPITNLFVEGVAAYQRRRSMGTRRDDLLSAVRIRLEY